MQADVGRREPYLADSLDHFERGENPGARFSEVHHHAVPQPFHRPPATIE